MNKPFCWPPSASRCSALPVGITLVPLCHSAQVVSHRARASFSAKPVYIAHNGKGVVWLYRQHPPVLLARRSFDTHGLSDAVWQTTELSLSQCHKQRSTSHSSRMMSQVQIARQSFLRQQFRFLHLPAALRAASSRKFLPCGAGKPPGNTRSGSRTALPNRSRWQRCPRHISVCRQSSAPHNPL